MHAQRNTVPSGTLGMLEITGDDGKPLSKPNNWIEIRQDDSGKRKDDGTGDKPARKSDEKGGDQQSDKPSDKADEKKEQKQPEKTVDEQRGQHKLKTRLSKGEKRNSKRMATVASVYSVAPHKRSPESIMSREDKATAQAPPRARNKRVFASVKKDAITVCEELFQVPVVTLVPRPFAQ